MSQSTSTESNDHIEKLQELHEKILQAQNESQGTDLLEKIQEIIEESSKIVEKSNSPNEMIVDAKILYTGTNIVSSNISSLNTNLTCFSESKYINGLLGFLRENSFPVMTYGGEWACFAPLTYHLFRKSHPVTYMLGMLTLEPPPPKEKIKVERQKKGVEAQKKVLSSVKEKEKAETEEEGSDIYSHILKQLVSLYKRNKRNPISYFNFIIDPTSYWKTVENIFHFAFLVRDGSVKMQIKKGLPYVEPVAEIEERKTGQKGCDYQFCFTLSMPDWKKCIEKFDVKSPCIPPFVKKR